MNSRTTKPVYPVFEAAKILHCTVHELLQHGKDGRLHIFFPTPDDVQVFNVSSSSDLRLGNRSVLRCLPAARATNIEYLLLDNAACTRLLSDIPHIPGVFDVGATFDADCKFRILSAEGCIDRSQKVYRSPEGDRKFGVYSLSTQLCDENGLTAPKRLTVTLDSLIVSCAEILKLKGTMTPATNNVPDLAPLHENPNLSENLRRLHDLYCKIWSLALQDNFQAPSKLEIEDTLVDKYGFSKNLAACGAQILSDSKLIKDEDGSYHVESDFLDNMISCSLDLWFITPRNPTPNPSSAEVKEWLRAKLKNLPNSTLDAAATILRPANAPKGRRSAAQS